MAITPSFRLPDGESNAQTNLDPPSLALLETGPGTRLSLLPADNLMVPEPSSLDPPWIHKNAEYLGRRF